MSVLMPNVRHSKRKLTRRASAEIGLGEQWDADESSAISPRQRRLRMAVLTVFFVLVFGTIAYGAAGHWQMRSGTQAINGSSAVGDTATYDFVDESGNVLDSRVSTTKPLEAPEGHTLDETGTAENTFNNVAVQTATGIDMPVSESSPYTKKGDPILGDYDEENYEWENEGPTMGTNVLIFHIANMIGTLVQAFMSFGEWAMSLASPEGFFNLGFRSGKNASMLAVAEAINKNVAVPYGTAFLTLSFVYEIIKLTDRRRYGGVVWFESFLRLAVTYAVVLTLVTHAMEIMQAIYWLGLNLYRGVARFLVQVRMPDGTAASITLTGLGGDLRSVVCGEYGRITYEQWGLIIPFLLITLMGVSMEVKLALDVVTLAALRTAEIYARAAFAGFPMAFAVSQDARPIMVGYLKRFAAACFVAAVIVVSMALAKPLCDLVAVVLNADGMAKALKSMGLLKLLANTIANLAPTIIGLGCVDGIIKKSNDIANGLFGL